MGVGYYSEQEPANGFPHLTRAGLIEELVLLDVPDSPGALHYVIHSYDQVRKRAYECVCLCVNVPYTYFFVFVSFSLQPGYADRALDAANHYLTVSTQVPHALHM